MAGMNQSLPSLPALSGSPRDSLLPSFRVRLAGAFAAQISWVLKVQARLQSRRSHQPLPLPGSAAHSLLPRPRLGKRDTGPKPLFCNVGVEHDLKESSRPFKHTYTFTGVQQAQEIMRQGQDFETLSATPRVVLDPGVKTQRPELLYLPK